MKMTLKIHLLLALLASPAAFALTPDQVEFFEAKIRPVLAESCYDCHNSVNKKKAGLALDYRDAMLAGGESGSVIEPGDPSESALIWAIRHEDGLEMPSEGPKLSESVVRDFEEWVRMGAPDPRLKKPTQLDLDNAVSWATLMEKRRQWWSFQPLEKTRAPEAKDADWNQSPIDRFIFAGLEKQGLPPAEEASPEVLARRLHLILTGLPPKQEVVKAFVNDPSSEAYQAMVESLLASPEYGKRWARHWMDWYRFAESHGSEGDPKLPFASSYRGYVIRALNQDVPYDQLLREHIAGDLMKKPRLNQELGVNESAIGPAHLRMVPHGFGVTDAYGEQLTYTDNQIDVLSKAMLGLTVSCARCHNHKFDPISQKDFYRLYGVLASNRLGTINVDTPERQALNKKALSKLKRSIRKDLADYWLGEVDSALEALASYELSAAPEKTQNGKAPKDPQAQARDELKELGDYHPFAAMMKLKDLPAAKLEQKAQDIVDRRESDWQEAEAAKRNASFYADLRQQKTLDAWYRHGNGLGPKVSPAGSFAVAGEGDQAITGIYPSGVYSHLISDKHNAFLASKYHFAKGAQSSARVVGDQGGLKMAVRNYPLKQGLHPYETAENQIMQWQAFKKYAFWNEEQVHYQFNTDRDRPVGEGKDRSWFGVAEVIGGEAPMKDLGAPLSAVSGQGSTIKDRKSLVEAYRQSLENALLAWKREKLSDEQAEFLSAFVRFEFLPNTYDAFPESIKALLTEYRVLENEIPVPQRAPGVLEGEVVDQPLLLRGETKKEGEPVRRQFLEVFSDKPYSKKDSGRRELAEDLVAPENTLKSRVLVNRLWGYVFGQGIVSSTDNFGHLGKTPTHPELLDHLALEFEREGWSIKQALRAMVLSRTFRSASDASEKVVENDPLNAYLSYYTPRRLSAEAIMDSVNSVAGETFERGVYRKAIRNKLDPFLSTFNLPIPTSTVSKRDSTNVPAQALSMLNGEFVANAAQAWAKRIQTDQQWSTVEGKIGALFMDAYAREPNEEERERMLAYHDSINDPDTALKNIAFALLNTKEFIYVY